MSARINTNQEERTKLAQSLREFITADCLRLPQSPNPVKPDHYIPWKWPVHPISADYRLHSADWTSGETATIDGIEYPILVTTNDFGVFGKCEALRCEALGNDHGAMIENLRMAAKPLLKRRQIVGEILALEGPYMGTIRELTTLDLLKLFYASDRAIAYDAQVQIETGPDHRLVFEACVEMLLDRKHPNRRTAQWLVLDFFEDLPSVASSPENEKIAIDAIFGLIYDAEDDFARTIFKAGVVLGGHICSQYSAERLIELTKAPSKIARRSAVHACFHLVEWLPESKQEVLTAVSLVAQIDSEPLLRTFAASIVRDIAADELDHMLEPKFEGED